MRVGSLFTGYGGLDMAAETFFQATTAWTCDIDPGASKILAHRMPDAPNLGDITMINWDTVEPVDVLAGGWPCQPFSLAGKRKGAEDERALWPEVARAVRALRPRHVVLENVAAIATAGELARGVADLAALRYVGQWRCLRAADIGAPHGRARIFILATDTEHDGRNGATVSRSTSASETAGRMLQPERHNPAAADADLVGHQRSRDTRHRRQRLTDDSGTPADTNGDTVRQQPISQPQRRSQAITRPASTNAPTDTESNGWDERRPEPARQIRGSDAAQRSTGLTADTEGDTGRLSNRNNGATADTEGAERGGTQPKHLGAPARSATEFGERPSETGQRPERMMGYLERGNPAEARPDQTLRDVRQVDDPQTVRGQPDVGGHGPVPQSEELLAELRQHQEGRDEGRAALASQEASGEGVRRVRDDRGSARPSQGPQRREQRPDESADALFLMSPQTALARGSRETTSSSSQSANDCGCSLWGQYAPAIHRWEMVLGRLAPAPTELSPKGSQRLSPHAVEFMMGLPAGWVCDVPGLTRNNQLKALGNGVVPQQALAALTMMASP